MDSQNFSQKLTSDFVLLQNGPPKFQTTKLIEETEKRCSSQVRVASLEHFVNPYHTTHFKKKRLSDRMLKLSGSLTIDV